MPTSITDKFLSLNVLHPDYEPRNTWKKRLPILVDLFQKSGASVFALQECPDSSARDLAEALGLEKVTKHINSVLWEPTKWSSTALSAWNLPGIQERTLVVPRLASTVVPEAYVWAGVTHLSVRTSNPRFKNKVTEAMALASRKLQYAAINAHLANYQQIIIGYDSNDSDGHQRLGGWDHATTEGTDEVAVKDPPRARVIVPKLVKLKTNGGTDHKYANVATFTATNAPSPL
jgi:hypothetical protein